MNIAHALRLDSPTVSNQVISLVGAGGKSTTLFKLARQLQLLIPNEQDVVNRGLDTPSKNTRDTRPLKSQIVNRRSLIITATTHLGVWQIPLTDHHIIVKDLNDLKNIQREGITLITGELDRDLIAFRPFPKGFHFWKRRKLPASASQEMDKHKRV
ncbi:MAG: hypothetical protein FJZ86_12935 [Chloroflexi bacterium]|nr:hypothetical protein [Chloroflexota bacterium]